MPLREKRDKCHVSCSWLLTRTELEFGAIPIQPFRHRRREHIESLVRTTLDWEL
jgi:hypothetical protein